jgi:capsular polysaccharide transport system permease protein
MTENAPGNGRALAASRELRRARARRLAIGFAVWVGLPTLIAAVYYVAIATPQYESTAVVMIESNERGGGEGEKAEGWLPHAGTSRDVKVTQEYVRSRAMLDLLVKEHGFVEHYADEAIDRWSRLPADASLEARLAYFHDKVVISGDTASGTATLAVKAFSAEQAQKLAKAILAQAEKGMNAQTNRAWADQIALGEGVIKDVKARLAGIREKLAALGVKAPVGLAPSPGAPGSSGVAVAAVPVGSAAAGSEGEVESLLLERDLALRELESALGGLEKARESAARDRRYLISVADPSLPDQASYPKRLWRVATIFFTALALAGVLSLLVAAVREHAKL